MNINGANEIDIESLPTVSVSRDVIDIETFARNLSNTMYRKGIGPAELGRKIGKDATSVSHYKYGKRLPDNDTILDLAAALDCKPKDLLQGTQESVGRPALIRAMLTDCLKDIIDVGYDMGLEITVRRVAKDGL